ncbi:MAG TPA: MIP family channel protein [Acidimicrobiales bacterium]|nr:MIP family channel protein [Acidimicrobiales bacterium]
MSVRKLAAEFVGTALLVIFAVGAATLSFGFGLTGSSTSAGVITTAMAFGLVLAGLAYALGPVSGCHVNPAVTMGFLLARRISTRDAIGYWVAQFAGGIAGAVILWGVFESSTQYTKSTGLGTDGYDSHSMIHLGVGGAFIAEVILTFLFVLVVLQVTKHVQTAAVAGLAIGLALATVHLFGIPLTGTSVNPARSLGPALVVQGDALNQVWLFIVAPLIGGAIAALASVFFVEEKTDTVELGSVDVREATATQVTA